MALKIKHGRNNETTQDKIDAQKKLAIEQRKNQVKVKPDETFTKTKIETNKQGIRTATLGSMTYSAYRNHTAVYLHSFISDLGINPNQPWTLTVDMETQSVVIKGKAKKKAIGVIAGNSEHELDMARKGRAAEVGLTNFVGKDPLKSQAQLQKEEADAVKTGNKKGVKTGPAHPKYGDGSTMAPIED